MVWKGFRDILSNRFEVASYISVFSCPLTQPLQFWEMLAQKNKCHVSETLEAARILSMEKAETMAHSHSGVPVTLNKNEVFMDKQSVI